MDLATTPSPPRRLPDELILMVVDSCDQLRPGRARTHALAALCRLARRYHAHAQRVLYSRIRLVDENAARLERGSLLDALVRNAPLRRLVQVVEVGGDVYPLPLWQVRHVLEDLPSVVEVHAWNGGQRAVKVNLAQENLKLRRLSFNGSYDIIKFLELAGRHSKLSETLIRLDLEWLYTYSRGDNALKLLSALTSFGVTYSPAVDDFSRFIAPFRSNLVELRLRVYLRSAHMDLGVFPHLQFLMLYAPGGGEEGDSFICAGALSDVVPGLVKCLLSGAGLPTFNSFRLHGALQREYEAHEPEYDPRYHIYTRASPSHVPPSSAHILDALPPHLKSLSLTTSFLRPDDVAAYLLSPRRPTALRRLRIGDEVGRGLGAILRGEGGSADEDSASAAGREDGFGALAGVLERAGVEVTTIE